MEFNAKTVIDDRPLTGLQYATIFVCFLMNMLDGMDVLVISYTAPAIADTWAVSPEALGIVFSMGLFGMTFGALLLAPYADKIGRKNMILISALLMGISIFLTSFAQSVGQLMVYRFISGLGIGSMLASTAALAAEYTPNKTRDFWVSFVISGYPVGAVLSGIVAARVVPAYGWPVMYQIAGIASFVTIPMIYFFLSESLDFYLRRHPKDALAKANKILIQMGVEPLSALPPQAAKQAAIPVRSLLHSDYRLPTFQLWFALFLAFATLYFLTSWIPKLATNAGLSLELAIYAGTVFNVGAVFGIVLQGYFSSRYGLKRTIGIFLILTAVLMAIFRFFVGSDVLLLVFGLLGFGIQGGFVGLYAVAARMYPTEFRTTGVGWSIGIGRLGGIIGPAVGGILIGMGLSMSTNFLVYAIPTVLAGIMTMRISSKKIS
ncbi:MFS transporter [Flavilitoribacter nigricans]|uniref:MFS transporter n=1 Tax=Flavilitoribacter nigricans (strain ATCC 23147 / DSM 23189 / NBRC 102662 / NCIMB 1420 / SS-2) TaxID=1122177 RepID=A0A2D0N0K7_FLAN2|nr:MFS transporter [Flavilitoribacter nigricans]PHN01908.1 MFS transporter [Flavilitoribacter nigricans DSM 23189 = NBRC 102662]